jgi:hypothetical protein
MGQEKVYMGQESLLGWDRRRRFDGTEKVDIHPNKVIFWQQMYHFYSCEDDCYQNCKVIVANNFR